MSAEVTVSKESLPDLQFVTVGGDVVTEDVVAVWAKDRLFLNSYGPTEATVACTVAQVRPGQGITIGKAFGHYEVHVLDPDTLELTPVGERGVLFIGGPTLARGYLNEAEKTAERFVNSRWGRLFNSGDACSLDKQGNITLYGRVNFQVKVRGLRIELEAVESAVKEIPGVFACEARAIDGQSLVMLVSGAQVEEQAVKAA